jgi:hypothetical protein
LHLKSPGTGKFKKVGHETIEPAGFLLNDVQEFRAAAFVMRLLAQDGRGALDAGERIANLMRQSCRHVPQRRHARGTLQMFDIILQLAIHMLQLFGGALGLEAMLALAIR